MSNTSNPENIVIPNGDYSLVLKPLTGIANDLIYKEVQRLETNPYSDLPRLPAAPADVYAFLPAHLDEDGCRAILNEVFPSDQFDVGLTEVRAIHPEGLPVFQLSVAALLSNETSA
jgi:hypothetical protein